MSSGPRWVSDGSELTPADRRYEPFVRPVPPGSERATATWRWRRWQVHLEKAGSPDAPVRLLLVHGAGGNAAAMWPIAAHLAATGTEVTVVDLPGYGRTGPTSASDLSYRDWQDVLLDLVDAQHDERPLIIVGASMGGMLALDTAARSEKVSRVAVTCLLDLSDPSVRREALRARWMDRTTHLLRLVPRRLRGLSLPLRWIIPMDRIANDPGLTAAVRADRRGGGGTMPLGWCAGVVSAGPAVRPEDYRGAPVLLLHPGADRWTRLEISRAYLDRVPGSTRCVVLPGTGHFPVEEPGFQVLLDEVGVLARELRPHPSS